MLILLSDTLNLQARGIADQSKLEGILDCVHNLCQTYREGKHLLRGKRKELEWLRRVSGDREIERVTNNLIQNISTSGIPDEITEYIEVGDWQEKTVVQVGDKTIHRVPYLWFADSMSCQETMLICEDANDCTVFNHILRWYIKQTGRQFYVRNEACSGGGDNTGRELLRKKDTRKILISITDTDERYPGAPINADSTLQKILDVQAEVDAASVFCLYVMNVHEIENILPLKYYEEAGIIINPHFRNLWDNDNVGLLRYFDIKKGHTVGDTANQDYRNFARSCYQLNPLYTIDFEELCRCGDNRRTIFHGLGKSILGHVVRWLNTPTASQTGFVLKEFQLDEWGEIGKRLLNYSVARGREAMN